MCSSDTLPRITRYTHAVYASTIGRRQAWRPASARACCGWTTRPTPSGCCAGRRSTASGTGTARIPPRAPCPRPSASSPRSAVRCAPRRASHRRAPSAATIATAAATQAQRAERAVAEPAARRSTPTSAADWTVAPVAPPSIAKAADAKGQPGTGDDVEQRVQRGQHVIARSARADELIGLQREIRGAVHADHRQRHQRPRAARTAATGRLGRRRR